MKNKKYRLLEVGKVKKKKNVSFYLLSVGGMNSEIVSVGRSFDSFDEVMEYCNEKEICDINGVRFRNSYDEDYWMREEFMCECYNDEVEESVVGVYGINEGLELVEVV